MGLRASSHVAVAKAGEVVQESGGLHLLEFHGPTAGVFGALLLLAAVIGFAWACFGKRCRIWHLCCLKCSGSSNAPQSTLEMVSIDPVAMRGRYANWEQAAMPKASLMLPPYGMSAPTQMMELAGGTPLQLSMPETPNAAPSTSLHLAQTGTLSSLMPPPPTSTSTLPSWMTPMASTPTSNQTVLNPFMRTPSRASWRPSFTFGQP
ncbi:MAG: hypothetical protein HC888_04760 [Candidatus Competibacteraceae bacterium]|nr:hypothetical protein [Candidatus Competibacteraceae bacterium]